MKLLTLNIWGGQVHQELINFLKEQCETTDIFCFQEMLNGVAGEKTEVLFNAPNAVVDIYSQIKELLPEFQGYFAPSQDEEGLAIFIRKEIVVKKIDDIFVYLSRNSLVGHDAKTFGRNIQLLEFVNEGKDYVIANFHGLWAPGGKGDIPERLEQSKKIMEILNNLKGTKILCGDFNLWGNTKSVAILEEGLRNLVKEYRVSSTRSSLYAQFLDENDRLADYIFVSSDVKLLDFKALTNEVSDHLPLYLEFD